MLIAFEGQDGVGKTELLRATYTELTRQGIAATTVDEFSNGPYGQRLRKALARDKFLRPVRGEAATVLTRALEIVADLYYLDELVIAPAIEAGQVVLKDRHLDTVLYTQVPLLIAASAGRTQSRVMSWLSILLSELHYTPALTVYVDAPMEDRLKRIKRRRLERAEDRARQVSREDLEVFAAREQIVQRLMAAEPQRFLTVDNSRPLAEGVSQILELIHAGRSGAS
jgi:thymidylate kinase